LSRKGSFFLLSGSLAGPAGPKSAKSSTQTEASDGAPQGLVPFWAS
jgi:hypothetical protein